MLTTNPVLKAVALILPVALAGCVNQPAHQSWPKPVPAATLSQFAGMYQNKSSDNKTGKDKVSATGQGFYYFLTGGRDDDMEYDGDRLAIRFSPDGGLMKLRLFDARGKVIQSDDLRRGVQFDFINGMIVRKVGSQGFSGGIDGAVTGASHNRYVLQATAQGGILGHENSTGGILVAFIVPVGGSANIWNYWPRLGDASDSVQKSLHREASLMAVNVQKLPDGITLAENSLKDDLIQILTQRGGKDPKDLWIVDRHQGAIRIRKSRLDGVIYPPGTSVEFWRKGNNGRWMRLPTA